MFHHVAVRRRRAMASLMAEGDLQAMLGVLEGAARAAGAVALARYRPGAAPDARVSYKEGGSPVTEADHAANAVLIEHLRDRYPDHGWLSEETADTDARLSRRAVFVVDPIDGTRAFLAGADNWTVCAALVVDGEPVAGVVHAPVLDLCLTAARGFGAHANGRPLMVGAPAEPCRFTGPRPMFAHLAPPIGGGVHLPRIASLAFRLVSVALGQADIALASGNAHDWDIAASDIILSEAGGRLTDLDGNNPVYNRPDPVHPALIAGAPPLLGRLLAVAEGGAKAVARS
jgi:myo-inositol-1(or 4)-monophosphatase